MTRKNSLICDLKTRRQTVGWSIKELSDRCGIDEAFLSDWESGLGSPRFDEIQHWAAALSLALELVPAESQSRHGLLVDWEKHCIKVDGTPIRLTPMEWKALERLARTPGELVTHQALFRHLYGDDRHHRAQSTAVRVLITKLRRLLPIRIDGPPTREAASTRSTSCACRASGSSRTSIASACWTIRFDSWRAGFKTPCRR